jgi:hypothetical protein
VGLNEAQLINPQGTNKNMVARNLMDEWLKYGKVVYKNGEDIVIEGNDEFLVVIGKVVIHLTRDRILVVRERKHYVASIPLRGRPRRGIALKTALDVLSELPNNIVGYMLNKLPVLATIS